MKIIYDITDTVKYVGINDREADFFEGQYVLENGMAYNSYVILDEKIAVMDSVERAFGAQWIENVKKACAGREPDYLIVQHMEPDHSACITEFAQAFPKALIVSSQKAFSMMKAFFKTEFENRRLIVKEGDTLELGEHRLCFIAAPMVHWPEVIMTYEQKDKILFSADGFGKFGVQDADEDWACEARRYYFGIVGKYGPQVQAVLKKAAALDIEKICPLHGPVLTENLAYHIGLYDKWSRYEAEDSGVTIAYTSVYGHTQDAVKLLERELESRGRTVSVFDLARCDMAEAVEDAFRYDTLVLATTTYNTEIFPFMADFIRRIAEHGYQKRRLALIENGSWAPTAAKVMSKMLEGCRELELVSQPVTIRSAMSEENERQIKELAALL